MLKCCCSDNMFDTSKNFLSDILLVESTIISPRMMGIKLIFFQPHQPEGESPDDNYLFESFENQKVSSKNNKNLKNSNNNITFNSISQTYNDNSEIDNNKKNNYFKIQFEASIKPQGDNELPQETNRKTKSLIRLYPCEND